jgi:hypothetical protein
MPTVTIKKNAGSKTGAKGKTTAKAKTGAKATATKATTAKASNGRRTTEDVDKLVPAFVKHLQGGGTMRALKAEHGFSDDGPIRQALARAGKDSKGNALELPTVKATPAGIKSARSAGHAWYLIALAVQKTEAEVKALAEKAGVDTSGRVRVGGGRGK